MVLSNKRKSNIDKSIGNTILNVTYYIKNKMITTQFHIIFVKKTIDFIMNLTGDKIKVTFKLKFEIVCKPNRFGFHLLSLGSLSTVRNTPRKRSVKLMILYKNMLAQAK